MKETAYIKCPNCGNEEFVVPENLDEANLYYTCSSCSHEYEVGFFDVCPSCNKPVGFYEGGAFKKDMLALGKIALNTALNPASYLGVLKDYAGMAVNNFTGNLIDGNGDGVCPYCQKRYVRCGVCHELTPIDPNLTFKDSFICSSCGRTVAPNGVRPGCGSFHSKAYKQLRLIIPKHSNFSSIDHDYTSEKKQSCTKYDIRVEIKDDKQYGQTQQLLKIFADCLRVPASTLVYNDKISFTDRKKLRNALLKWYNISVSSNISNCDYLTYADLASLIIDESRRKAKEKTTVKVAEVQYKDFPSDLRANYQPSSDPQGKRNLPFKMKVEQVFELNGKGHIATGTIETGFIKENDLLCVNGDIQHPIRFIAAEMFRKILPYAEFDDNVGLLVDLCGHTVAPGDILSKLGEQSTAKLEEKSPSQTESTNDKEQEYIDELKECLANGSISDGERRLLNKIRSKLGISEERAAELEQLLLTPQLTEDEQEYLDAFKDAMDDGNISDAERRLLDKIKKYNNISDERAVEIEKML